MNNLCADRSVDYDFGTMNRRWRPVGLFRLALAFVLTSMGPARAEVGFGRITLKSGEVIEGDVARHVGENCIVRTPGGLRVIPRASVEKTEAGVDLPPAPRATPRAKAVKKAAPPKPAEDPSSSTRNAVPEAKPPEKAVFKRLPDSRLDAARAGGPPPVLEIVAGGSIDGKPIATSDPFTVARLTFFFSEASRPRFEVLAPGDLRQPDGKKTAAASARKAEYRAEVSGISEMKELRFYDTPVLKTFRSQLSLKLVRLSDKKVVDGLEVVEDEGGDPANREELCRKAYQRSVESLVKELRTLPTFGGTAEPEDKNGSGRASAKD